MVVVEHADVAYAHQAEVNGVGVKQQLSALTLYRVVLPSARLAALSVGLEARHYGVKLGLVDRFQQEVERPVPERGQHIVAVSGVDYDVTPEVCLLLQPLEKLQAGHVGQLHVEEQQLGLVPHHLPYAVLAAGGGGRQRNVFILSKLRGQVGYGRRSVVYDYSVYHFSVRFNAFQPREPHPQGYGYRHLAPLNAASGTVQVPYREPYLALAAVVDKAYCAAYHLQSRAG